ncbi:MAG: transglycosylase family protein [Nevskia sp.]|nr:transglycosylase family protein [Nevskia sp.]
MPRAAAVLALTIAVSGCASPHNSPRPTLDWSQIQARDIPHEVSRSTSAGGRSSFPVPTVSRSRPPTTIPATPTDAQLLTLRLCESGGDYHINTGNGYYGAYQFDLRTWHGLGYDGLPSDAPPAVQDEAVRRLYALRGWQPWPVCGIKAGKTREEKR